MLLFVGVAGVGKSTILDTIAKHDTRFGRTGSVGTRPPQARDKPGLYTQLDQEEMMTKIVDREVVQYAVHPTTDTIYATLPNMYRKPYNMLETLPVALNGLKQLPFMETRVLYMVTEPSAWQQWFKERYPDNTSERQKRLQEALSSLTWALSQDEDNITWVKNMPGKQKQAAEECIRLTTQPPKNSPNYRDDAQGMLAIASAMV